MSGAEGATAPETLRHKGPLGLDTLESSDSHPWELLTEGGKPAAWPLAKSLRFHDDRGGTSFRLIRSRLCLYVFVKAETGP